MAPNIMNPLVLLVKTSSQRGGCVKSPSILVHGEISSKMGSGRLADNSECVSCPPIDPS